MSIQFKINLPDRQLPKETAAKVVLPIAQGNLTVIDERAPTMQLLKAGVVALLDEDNQAFKKWFINGGVANIAENKCQIAVEEAIDLHQQSIEDVEQKAKEHVFYRQVYDYLKAFGS